MVWKTVVNADAGDADHFGGNDGDKISLMFNGSDVSDTVLIHANVTWTFAGVTTFNILESDATNPAAAGTVRLGSGQSIHFRNAANTDDLSITTDKNDDINWSFNGTIEYIFRDTGLDLANNTLLSFLYLESNATFPATTGAVRLGTGGVNGIAIRNDSNDANYLIYADGNKVPEGLTFSTSGGTDLVISESGQVATSSAGWFSNTNTIASPIASTGDFRLTNITIFASRNVANTDNLQFHMGHKSSDEFSFNINGTMELQIQANSIDAVNGAKMKENGVNISPIGLHDIYIDGGGIIPTDSEPTDVHTYGASAARRTIVSAPFLTGVDTFATVKFTPPRTYDGGTVRVRFTWAGKDPGDTGDVVWSIAGSSVDDDQVIHPSYGAAQTVTQAGGSAANVQHVTAYTSAITIGGVPGGFRMCYFKISRLGADVGDTNGETVYLIGLSFELTTDTAVSV